MGAAVPDLLGLAGSRRSVDEKVAVIVVVGAGAAGIVAAWKAASSGKRVTLLEKTNRLGTKILISGGGKCNITHDGPIEDVLSAFRKNEAQFIRPSCYRFPPRQIVEMLTRRGLKVYTRPDNRIFPSEGTAKDVVAILRQYLIEVGVDIRLESPVTGVVVSEGQITGVQTSAGDVEANKVILCSGGSSYPATGTTGDGWVWAKSLGHQIVRVRAALAPIYLSDADPEKSGIALRSIVLKARQGGREVTRWNGDLLFTHRGVSGPTVLGISRKVVEAMDQREPIALEVDLAPGESFEVLNNRIKLWLAENPRKQVSTLVTGFVPESLVSDVLSSAQLEVGLIGSSVAVKARNRLVEVLKGWKIGTVRGVPIEKGECVAGGVSLDEVDPQTMASRLVKGLYLCGEILDIAGPVGGYNLQAAFAMGFVAGESAAT